MSNNWNMNKATSEAAILSISLDRSSKTPLQTQLSHALRELVHTSRLRSGARLPSSRNLAQELGVSRVTTTAVYEQLVAEGYLEGRRGSGVFIAADLPSLPVLTPKDGSPDSRQTLPLNDPLVPFDVGFPDLETFPYREWTRIHDRIWRAPNAGILGRLPAMGFGPLRTAIARHLNEWRGIQCSPGQIVVTSGLVEAVELISKAAFAAGDTVLVEDPGHKVMANALAGSGVTCNPVRVDAQGFNLSSGDQAHLCASAVAVTPSRQYPLGMTLSLTRRLELLDWAKNCDGFILEDDYDGEFRYQGQPLPAMMSLDDSERVIYIGSFSKVMFPALRLGYMIVPYRLQKNVAAILGRIGPKAALHAQPVLAEFIASGSFATHIRRMRRLYAERQKALLNALHTHASGLLSADPETSGMHLVAELGPGLAGRMSDVEVSARAHEAGLRLAPLSNFYFGPAARQGLVMGYAAFPPQALSDGVIRLVAALCD